jgi:succinate dehydrogenase hydrophobic anchor subunit
MALYSRSGRPRPQSGGFELAAWYFMRLSGVALFVLALTHFSLQHFLSRPAGPDRDWIFNEPGTASSGAASTG